jgi:hypothetical protein
MALHAQQHGEAFRGVVIVVGNEQTSRRRVIELPVDHGVVSANPHRCVMRADRAAAQ